MPSLLRQELDLEDFPEFLRDPGVFNIVARLLEPGEDRRIPAPKDSPLILLSSYWLLANSVPDDATLELTLSGPRPVGIPERVTYRLIAPPPPGDNQQRIVRPPNQQRDPGTVWYRVFWVDLAPLLRDGRLRPGDEIAITFGTAAAHVRMPPR